MIEQLLREAAALERDGRDSEAVTLLEQAAPSTERPDDVLCARLASVHLRLGNHDEAQMWAVRTVDGGTQFTPWRAASRVLDSACPRRPPWQRRELRVAVLATSTATSVLPCLKLALARAGIAAELYEAPFGQYWQEALDGRSGLRAFGPDVVVHVPDHHALDQDVEVADPDGWVNAEVARWTGPWHAIRSWSSAQLVQVSFVAPDDDPFGAGAATRPGSRRARLRSLDRALADEAAATDVAFVDAEAIAAAVGKRQWFDPRYWHVAKHAFSMAVAPQLALGIASAIAARAGLSRKVLVVDLDNTLWHGVIGDDGLAGIELSGPRGEAHADFQRAVRDLGERGIVLAASSKNDPPLARLPFEQHPEMVLQLDDFAVFLANWDPKPDNIREIARHLSLPLDSFVFADDNPAEREAIRRGLPGVDVLALSDDPARWRDDLARYPWFEPGSITDEDRHRTRNYRARAAATRLEAASESLEDFRRSLGMQATISAVDDVSFDRVVQLIGKTNQFNLTTRRHGADAVRRMVHDPDWVHLTARLTDRFADHGLVAVALAKSEGTVLDVDTLLMSCRVIGRGLETVLIEELIAGAQVRGHRAVRGHHVPTDRNSLVADLWVDHGFHEVPTEGRSTRTFQLDLDGHVPRLTQIAVRRNK